MEYNSAEIKKLRKELKLTREQMAKALGVTEMTIYNWENVLAKPSKLARRQLARLERKKEKKS